MNDKRSLTKTFSLFVLIIIILNACAAAGTVPSTDQSANAGQAANGEQAVRYEQEQNYNILRGILRMNHNFRGTTENKNIKLQFDYSNENLSVLRTKYGLDAIAGTGGDLSKSLNILFWLCEHVCHNGDYDNHIPMNSLDLLEYAYDKNTEQALNCLNLSFILAECLLSIGVPARSVGIFPFSPYDADNHVVTHVYIADIDKWIMLDPTWCAYFKDADGNILDAVELRDFLAEGREVFLNKEYAYNGDKLIANSASVWDYKRYLAKDLFYFIIFENSSFGRENYGRALSVCPAGFSLFESEMYRMEYNIEFIKTYKGASEEMRQSYIESATAQLEEMRKSAAAHDENAMEKGYFYLSLEDFLARPDLKNE
ncbi:MAG: transglutaminase domain-containing protein [Spirochaetaceae bacterium]|nr:transglutaminase domain-containing protein [Spirochaetaceae bacterium]